MYTYPNLVGTLVAVLIIAAFFLLVTMYVERNNQHTADRCRVRQLTEQVAGLTRDLHTLNTRYLDLVDELAAADNRNDELIDELHVAWIATSMPPR